jgi:dynein heavy chain 1, cytosolic
VANALSLLKRVRRDLDDLLLVCDGKLTQTNHLRALIADVNRGVIPRHWRKYKVAAGVSLAAWVADLAARMRQLEAMATAAAAAAAPGTVVWLGGLLAPEAYITATRQAVAQSNHWSLEELALRLEVATSEQPERDTFLLSGLRLEGAAWTDGRVRPSDAVVTRLPTLRLRWVHHRGGAAPLDAGSLLFPVYLNWSRADVLFTVHVPVHDLTEHAVAQRAIAFVVSALK